MDELILDVSDVGVQITLSRSGELYSATQFGDCGSYLTPEIAVRLSRELIRWAVTQSGEVDD